MTQTNSIASKLTVAFVAVAMMFSAFASTASAQTTEDLQQMINDLLAQVAGLQSQIGGGDSMSAAGVCPYTWTRSLNVGAKGADVMKLQQFLNANADTRVSVSGAGSAGSETEYYGPATSAAVSKFQVANRAAILSPVNLVNPTGFFGPSTIAEANAQCASAPVVDDSMDDSDDSDDSMDDSDDSSDDSDNGPLSGEADLDSFNINGADDDTIEEGSEDAEIAEFEIEFADGDAEVSRIDIMIEGPSAAADPWKAFETFSLWVDGDKVAEENADDEDDYLDEDDGTFRFTGLDLLGREDDEMTVVLAATVQNNLDTDEQGSWDVSAEALRFFDADGVATTEEAPTFDLGETESFTIEEAGNDDELIVKTSSNDPDGTTLPVETDSDSDWFSVFVFDLDTDDSENDVSVDRINVTVTVSSSTFDALVDDVEIVIDGVTIDDLVDNNGATAGDYTDGATVVISFDVDGDVEIEAGEEVEAELMLKFNSLAAGDEGTTVTGSVTGTNADDNEAEGADDLDNTAPDQLRGAAQGDAHTLRTEGLILEDGTHDFETQGTNDDTGIFEIVFEVTAFEDDFYIAKNATTTGTNTDGGVDFTVTGPGGTQTISGALSSTADEDTVDVFTVSEGSTETFTLKVTVDTTVTGLHSVQLNSVWFTSTTDGVTGVSTETPEPLTDYRVVDENINA